MSPMRRMYSLLKSRGSKHFGSITHCDPSFDLLTISCRLSAWREEGANGQENLPWGLLREIQD